MNHVKFLARIAQVSFLGLAIATCLYNVVIGTLMIVMSVNILHKKMRYK
jgi:hypothetical protein